ncbi:hypothetical protein ACFV8T_38420 [Streptomyces sp. NPDC059832]|uniref:hypothetical protein n=1 Tax=Streptomyces sp. NPDC059832 TaxID=3346966 RepID=UPI00364798C1
MKAWDRGGNLVDNDTFTAGQNHTFNLGTSDGSGDITEGFKVSLILAAGACRTPPIVGIA